MIRSLARVALFIWIMVLSAQPGAAQGPQPLRVGLQALPPTLFNPYRNTGLPYVYTWSAVFDGLTSIDANGNLQPWLATAWERIDPVTWVLELRKDVTFSNGKPMTARAVVAAIDFLTSDDAKGETVARMLRFLKSARPIGSHTVEITTNRPTPLLPRFLPQLYVVEPDHFSQLGLEAFAQDPIATGPFIVEDIRPERMALRAFEAGWRPPNVERMELLSLPDMATRTMSIGAGTLDVAVGIGPDEVNAIVADGGNKFSWRDAANWAYHFIDDVHPALADIRVREALNLAIDRQAIIDALLDGATAPATQPAPKLVYGFNPELPSITYDPDRARALLADAGYPDGFKMVIEATAGSSANDSAVNLTVAQYLAAVGIEMEIRTVNVNQIIRNVVEGTWDVDAFGLHYNFEPSVEALRALDTNSCLWRHPWYCREEVMPLIAQAEQELDPEKNLKLRQDVMAFYRNDWASLFMYQAPRFAGSIAGVDGVEVINNFILYDRITLDRR
ncbi:MAG: ABC transporter substrate-binding protein [Rhodospirillaceae bacterium]|nr:ABC transporter substrate-binding protein [Rhodospirillaceae bacterium]